MRPIDVVVVADSDMLDDRLWAQTEDFFGRRLVVPTAGNADFVANAVEVLAGGDDLVGLRSRGTSARPFEVVERIQRAADERYAAEQRTLERKLKETEAKLHDLTAGEPANASAAAPENAKRRCRRRRPRRSISSAPTCWRPGANCGRCRPRCGTTSRC